MQFSHNILTKHGGKGGYSKHPETLRWAGKTRALYSRHEALVKEFVCRGYKHHTPLENKLAKGKRVQDSFINTVKEQEILLKNKPCECLLHR